MLQNWSETTNKERKQCYKYKPNTGIGKVTEPKYEKRVDSKLLNKNDILLLLVLLPLSILDLIAIVFTVYWFKAVNDRLAQNKQKTCDVRL